MNKYDATVPPIVCVNSKRRGSVFVLQTCKEFLVAVTNIFIISQNIPHTCPLTRENDNFTFFAYENH